MRSKPRTTAEKLWHDNIVMFAKESAWLGEMYSGIVKDPYNFQLDHVIGAQAKRKVNGVSVKVGEWAVMPIPTEIHDITSNHRLSRTLKPAAYRAEFGNEKQVWYSFYKAMERQGYETPLSDEVIEGILR